MIGAAIIVLREVFEAALIIGIVLAGTQGVARRGWWVTAGVGAGLAGAVVVALFASRIADALEGVGQEWFNAVILLIATLTLGWHNVWMKQHGRELARDMQSVGRAVASGVRPLSVLMVVVGLAVLREGSEVVLFLYGISAAGTDAAGLAIGSAIGLAAGVAIGVAVFHGLLRVPQRYLFSVTGILLLLLAAGMASQAAGFLVQAGALPPLGDPVWDSSGLVAEHGVLGQVLHALVGYAERPSGLQLIFFGVVAGVIALLMRRAGRFGERAPLGRAAALAAPLLALAALGLPRPANAGLVVYSPVVEAGEYAVELRMQRDVDGRPDRNGAEEHKAEFEFAPTANWLTEGLVTYKRDPGGARRATEISWENIIALAPQGQNWADVGLLFEYAHALVSDGHDAIEVGLLAEKEFGKAVVTVNVTGEQALTAGSRAELGYSLRAKWRLAERFEPGVEFFGDCGEWGRLGSVTRQRHQIGPSVTGRARLAPHRALRYEAAWVFGVTQGAPDSTARLQLEYEF